MVAERAQITRPTLWRAERGDASVALGTYATILWVLGLGDRIGQLAAPETDVVGLSLADEQLPLRISAGPRATKRKTKGVDPAEHGRHKDAGREGTR